MGTKVLLIGLDAASSGRIQQFAAEGRMPTIAAMTELGGHAALDTPLETLPGAIWPELVTGVSGGRVGLFYVPWQVHTGEAYGRPVEVAEVSSDQYFWTVAARAGKRVAVIDQVQTVPDRTIDALQLFEWGLHDRNFGTMSEPEGLVDELRARYGPHPITLCDVMHDGTHDGYRGFRDALFAGVEQKTEIALDLLARDDWDLFACAFSETHCGGHHLWHFFDEDHPEHDPAAPTDLREAVRDLYARTDRAVGRLIEAVGPETTTIVVSSHGMGVPTGGYQLMSEFVARLGLGTGLANYARVRRVVPAPVRSLLRRAVPAKVREERKLQAREFEAEGTRALAVKNNRCGAIRLNLIGRDPFGTVEPGADADALIDELRRELFALRDPHSGEPIVVAAPTADEAFGVDHNPDVPDLMVVFRDDLGIIESCESPRVGRIDKGVRTPQMPRTGDHLPESVLWASGPQVHARGEGARANTLDVAPTVLQLLDVPVPDWIDGKPIDWLR